MQRHEKGLRQRQTSPRAAIADRARSTVVQMFDLIVLIVTFVMCGVGSSRTKLDPSNAAAGGTSGPPFSGLGVLCVGPDRVKGSLQ